MIFVGAILLFLVVLALIPNKQKRLLKKVFNQPIVKLDKSLPEKRLRVQGKVTAINTATTPIFNQEAIIYESGFYTLNERERRDPDFHSYEHNWKLERLEKVKNNFLLEDNGYYALIKTDNSVDILNKTKNDINQYDIGFISSLNSSSIKFEDITTNLKIFMEKLKLPRYSINYFLNSEILRVKEQLLLDSNFVSVVGVCSVESIEEHPQLIGIVHPMTKNILVISSSEEPLYITDDMKTLYG